jgi:hypothetical protein
LSATLQWRRPVQIDALPRAINLHLVQGDDFTFRLVVNDAEGDPFDLAGSDVRAQIRSEPADEDLLGEFTIEADENVAYLTLPGALSAELPERTRWDFDVVEPGGITTTLAAGYLRLSREVSR